MNDQFPVIFWQNVLRNHVNGQKSGLNLVKVYQSVRKRNNRLGKLWQVFFGMRMKKSSSTTLRKGGAYYAALLVQLVNKIRKKRQHLEKKKIIFHDDNAPSHTLNVAQTKKAWIGFQIASASIVFFRPGPQRLLYVPKPQEMAVW